MNPTTLLACFGLLISASGLCAQTPKPQDDPKFIKKAALQIDQYIVAFYRNTNLAVPKVTDDATFLRIAHGRSIPRW